MCAEWERSDISIHALPAEGDESVPYAIGYAAGFQSTPSPRRATVDITIEVDTS